MGDEERSYLFKIYLPYKCYIFKRSRNFTGIHQFYKDQVAYYYKKTIIRPNNPIIRLNYEEGQIYNKKKEGINTQKR